MVFNIENIRELLQEDKIQWSGYVLSRMQQREIKIKDLIETILSGEMIEYYSTDYLTSSGIKLPLAKGSGPFRRLK